MFSALGMKVAVGAVLMATAVAGELTVANRGTDAASREAKVVSDYYGAAYACDIAMSDAAVTGDANGVEAPCEAAESKGAGLAASVPEVHTEGTK